MPLYGRECNLIAPGAFLNPFLNFFINYNVY